MKREEGKRQNPTVSREQLLPAPTTHRFSVHQVGSLHLSFKRVHLCFSKWTKWMLRRGSFRGSLTSVSQTKAWVWFYPCSYLHLYQQLDNVCCSFTFLNRSSFIINIMIKSYHNNHQNFWGWGLTDVDCNIDYPPCRFNSTWDQQEPGWHLEHLE